ncbi:MAG: hypothetical protein K9M49_07720 [Candidatus Marinimicrobia bacterium]|nr:hypothetical protein [Candidatus Neomarinimicrobiota bacterium]MCF7850957.1 hypothetical protein [Candidatus Neomarinimicrobiota bacterium]MCF7905027.1 hypothetical protein [Candidatus Neomarinimicrobiota bacterium]
MIFLIELALFIMTGLLIFHAIRSRSAQFALFFWQAGMVLGLLREVAMAKLSGLYTYGDFILTIGPVPFAMLLLWPNLAYISWEWANNYLGKEYFHERAMGQHLPLIFLTMMLASFLFESLFHQFQLIQWTLDPAIPIMLGSVPLLAPFAYGFTGLVFIKTFKILWNRPGESRFSVLTKLILVQPIGVLIIMGLLMITNLLIVLIFIDKM